MKRLGMLLFLLGFALALPAPVPAAEESTPAAQAPAPGEDADTKLMAARMLIAKSDMVATSDGGVILRAGGTLLKFDGALKLVGTADIPADRIKTDGMAPAWGKMHGKSKGYGMHCCQMAGGMENCPIHQKAAQGQQSAAPAEEDD